MNSQQTFTCSSSTINALEIDVTMFKVSNEDIDVVLVSLLLPLKVLHISHTDLVFHC